MRTTMDLQLGAENLFAPAIFGDVKFTREQATARAKLEYRASRAVFERQGITEAAYVASRLVDAGFAITEPSTEAADKPTTSDAAAPAWQRVPGLLAMNPTGNQVGSTD